MMGSKWSINAIFTQRLAFLCVSSDPPPIPPAPPVGFRTLNKQKKVLPRVSLPMLNWTPLHRVDHTMFMVNLLFITTIYSTGHYI